MEEDEFPGGVEVEVVKVKVVEVLRFCWWK